MQQMKQTAALALLALCWRTAGAATLSYYSSTSSWTCPSSGLGAVDTYLVTSVDQFPGCGKCMQISPAGGSAVTPFTGLVVGSEPALPSGTIGAGRNFGGSQAVTASVVACPGASPVAIVAAATPVPTTAPVVAAATPVPTTAPVVADQVAAVVTPAPMPVPTAVTATAAPVSVAVASPNAVTPAPTPVPTAASTPAPTAASTPAPTAAPTTAPTAAPATAANVAAASSTSSSGSSSSSASASSTAVPAFNPTCTATATYYSQPSSNGPSTFACASNGKPPTAGIPTVALAPGGPHGWTSDFAMCGMCLMVKGDGSGIGNSPFPTGFGYYQVANSCYDPLCSACHLDIYVGNSQSQVGGAGDGIWGISWQPIDCAIATAAYNAQGSNGFSGALPTGAAAGRRRLRSNNRKLAAP